MKRARSLKIPPCLFKRDITRNDINDIFYPEKEGQTFTLKYQSISDTSIRWGKKITHKIGGEKTVVNLMGKDPQTLGEYRVAIWDVDALVRYSTHY